MKIYATGNDARIKELQEKLKDVKHIDINYKADATEISEVGPQAGDLILDLNLDDDPENLQFYSAMKGVNVLGCAVKMQLAMMAYLLEEDIECNLIGINALPTFINRPKLELSLLNGKLPETLKGQIQSFGWDISEVKDRVGMVTPRVVLMIINEACYTLQEGTAEMDDIDLGMQLGTNYPRGPFDWADAIGAQDVYETLEAIYLDTHDERYKICPLLKTHYLLDKSFR